ncbi:hypothetical protein BT96DRAFT_1042639 [Gymnopus androsaceus JB14]|uniref:Uncharacterized protein n=1 Tax=Gymnopus androsaceus JB14 TaxID=1447944 RepID=A0A6A4HC86_9AGAR|nr:hypothetical protein BT96DRAFT_1042639 [Gymnopus androsaceus JB14]
MDQLHTQDDNSSGLLTHLIKMASDYISELVQRTSKPNRRFSPYNIANKPSRSRVSDHASPAYSDSSILTRRSSRSSSSSSFSRSESSPTRPPFTQRSQQRPPRSLEGMHLHQRNFASATVAEEPNRNHYTGSLSDQIPKPPGEDGRPNGGGYNLENVLKNVHGLSSEEYERTKKSIKELVLKHLDCQSSITRQCPIKLSYVRDEAIAKFGFLERYENHWVTDDFIRKNLKYQNKTPVQPTDAGSRKTLAPKSRLLSSHPYRCSPTLQLVAPKIAKPCGEAGRPGRGGYNLKDILERMHNWSYKDYCAVQAFIKKLVLERLDCRLPWTTHIQHSPVEVDSIRIEATAKFEFLNAYDNNWVVDDFIRSLLKYQRGVLRKEA